MILLDTSAFLKLYLPEKGGDALEDILKGHSHVAISRLAVIEAAVSFKRLGREGIYSADEISIFMSDMLSDVGYDIDVLPLTDNIASKTFETVLALDILPVRSADALHIQSAISAKADLFITADKQQAGAAEALGLTVHLLAA